MQAGDRSEGSRCFGEGMFVCNEKIKCLFISIDEPIQISLRGFIL